MLLPASLIFYSAYLVVIIKAVSSIEAGLRIYFIAANYNTARKEKGRITTTLAYT